MALHGKNAEAEAAFRESLKLRKTLLGSGNKTIHALTVALTMNGLGQHLARMNRLPEAEALMRRSLAMRRRAERPGHAYALAILDLGKVVERQNRLAEAGALDREGLTSLRNLRGGLGSSDRRGRGAARGCVAGRVTAPVSAIASESC